MMTIPVIMPKLGLTMTEGTIIRWLKAEGEAVTKDEPLLEILTDKANLEVEAPAAGRLHVISPEGALVPILEVIGEIHGEGAGEAPEPTPEPAPATPTGDRLRISPAARRLAWERGFAPETWREIRGTGPGGRIVTVDVQRLPGVNPDSRDEVELVPLTGVKGLVAQRLSESWRQAPQFSVTMDLVLDQLLGLRQELTPALEASRGTRLSVTDLLAKAVAAVLPEFRLLNAHVTDREVALQPRVNLGVAVASERGLVVPVIPDAANRRLSDLAAELKRLTLAARQGTLALDDLSGGTFTLSNLGMFGVRSFTAIVNPPQAAILAVGGAREEVKLVPRGLVAQTVASFTLTCDHRAVDGALAAGFLKRLKELVEGSELRDLCAL